MCICFFLPTFINFMDFGVPGHLRTNPDKFRTSCCFFNVFRKKDDNFGFGAKNIISYDFGSIIHGLMFFMNSMYDDVHLFF